MDPRHVFPPPGAVPSQGPVPAPSGKNVMSLVSQEDVLKIRGQNYAVISVVVPKDSEGSHQFALKIRGVYEDLEDANKSAKQISVVDPFFDVYVVECWKWLPLPPPEVPEGGRHYSNEEFEVIMTRYFKEMKERQAKMKGRLEQARDDAKNNEHGPVQEDAVKTEIEFEPTEVRVETGSGVPTIEEGTEPEAEITDL